MSKDYQYYLGILFNYTNGEVECHYATVSSKNMLEAAPKLAVELGILDSDQEVKPLYYDRCQDIQDKQPNCWFIVIDKDESIERDAYYNTLFMITRLF